MEIRVHYSAIDGFSKTRTFKTLKGAQRFAQKYVGKHPEIGTGYAVSGSGVGKVTVSGDATLQALFPEPVAPARLDAEGTAKPKTRLVGHARAGDCVGPGTVFADAIENVATGERTSLAAEPPSKGS